MSGVGHPVRRGYVSRPFVGLPKGPTDPLDGGGVDLNLTQAVASLPAAGSPPLVVGGVHGLGVAYAAVAVSVAHPSRPVLMLTPDEDSADAVARDLRFLLTSRGAAPPGGTPEVLRFPADERGPYAEQSPETSAIMERVAAQFALAVGCPPTFLVASAVAAARRVLPTVVLQRHAVLMVPGQRVDRDGLLRALTRGGYTHAAQVEDVGSCAVRGGIIDIWAPGQNRPVRVDLFGDEVESIRHFDPVTGRTLPGPGLEQWTLGPCREVILDDVTVPSARKALRDLADAHNTPTRQVNQMLADLEAGIPFFGIEGLLPALFPVTRPHLLDAMLNACATPPLLVVEDSIACVHALRQGWDALGAQHDRAVARGRMVFAPADHFADPDETERAMAALSTVHLERFALEEARGRTVDLASRGTQELRSAIVKGLASSRDHGAAAEAGQAHAVPADLLQPLTQKLKDLRAAQISTFVVADSLGGVERLRELLTGHGLGVRVCKALPDILDASALRAFHEPSVHAWLLHGRPHAPARGVELPALGVAFISEEDVFGHRQHRSPRTRAAFKTSLSDLEGGDYVVHVDHGVGIYRGLTRMALRGVEADYLQLEYAGGDKLYLPVTRINLVQRYAGADGGAHPRIDRLGGTAWENTKQRVKKAILAMAGELLTLYAKRELAQGVAMPPPDALYTEFEAEFPFDETPDQAKAISECLADLTRGKPMDRLVCGDVGYGKTEVALRAAMHVALSGKQVAVLAPTTVLAQQHFLTFSERMKNYPVRIEVISSFRAAKEHKGVLQRVKEGQVDILVGTHRLLNADVMFRDLGLLVVDEEHRFGVAHKERLKQMRTNAHVLTLSATPIPRTLQMSFFGVRDLSLIQTPPQDRRAVRTMVTRFSQEEIKEAITRELRRGGQVYFVHNRVQSIHAMRDFLGRLIPEARMGVGHGQMEPRALEDVMMKFIRKDLNLLLCTTIIESGIDIPSANTIIINRADRMGLAQLHQLRGRVGRSDQRAYALLLIPPASTITPQAKKRLEVLQRFADLGAGFQVAQHDLELRGAGELLGKQQHGHVAAVGFEMYADLLAQAVQELKGRAGLLSQRDAPDPEVNLPVRALIPDGYIPDVHERLALYQRLATADGSPAVYDEIGASTDLYGEPPPEVLALAEIMVLKLKLREMRARGLDAAVVAADKKGKTAARPRALDGVAAAATRSLEDGMRVIVTLGEGGALDPQKLLAWIETDPARRRLTPQMKLVWQPTPQELVAAGDDVTALCRRLLNTLLETAMPDQKPKSVLRPHAIH